LRHTVVTVRSLWTWLWADTTFPQNVFLVNYYYQKASAVVRNPAAPVTDNTILNHFAIRIIDLRGL